MPDQGYDDAVGTGPSGSAGAVYIVGGIGGWVEMDHEWYRFDMDTPRCDGRGDEDVEAAARKAARARSRWLWLRLPWMAADVRRERVSRSERRSAPRFVRQKTTAGPRAAIVWAVIATRSRGSTRQKCWWTCSRSMPVRSTLRRLDLVQEGNLGLV